MFISLIFENKGFDKIHLFSIFCCQDVIPQLPEQLQTDGNILVPRVTNSVQIKIT